MARIPTHTIEDAPAAARPLLTEMIQYYPSGRLLNMHAQMAHAPAVLEAYVSIRRATAKHGTLAGQHMGEDKLGLGVDWITPLTTQPWGNRSMVFRDLEGKLINVFSPGQATPG